VLLFTRRLISKWLTVRPWDLLSSKRSTSTRGNGRIMKEMAEEYSNGKMDLFIKATGRAMLLMAMGDSSMQTEMFMLVSGSKIEHLAKVFN
jgi:hypothetical protein